jgi:hypothetical protein
LFVGGNAMRCIALIHLLCCAQVFTHRPAVVVAQFDAFTGQLQALSSTRLSGGHAPVQVSRSHLLLCVDCKLSAPSVSVLRTLALFDLTTFLSPPPESGQEQAKGWWMQGMPNLYARGLAMTATPNPTHSLQGVRLIVHTKSGSPTPPLELWDVQSQSRVGPEFGEEFRRACAKGNLFVQPVLCALSAQLLAVAGSLDGSVFLYSLQYCKPLARFAVGVGAVKGMLWCKSFRYLITRTMTGVSVWNLNPHLFSVQTSLAAAARAPPPSAPSLTTDSKSDSALPSELAQTSDTTSTASAGAAASTSTSTSDSTAPSKSSDEFTDQPWQTVAAPPLLELHPSSQGTRNVCAMSLIADGRHLALVTTSNQLSVYDLSTIKWGADKSKHTQPQSLSTCATADVSSFRATVIVPLPGAVASGGGSSSGDARVLVHGQNVMGTPAPRMIDLSTGRNTRVERMPFNVGEAEEQDA